MADSGWSWTLDEQIPSDRGAGRRVIENVLERLVAGRWDSHDIFSVRLALEEAIVNAIKHGNRLDHSKCVQVVCKMGRDRIWIRIADEGPGFKPQEVPDPTDAANLTNPNGRGIMLMRSYMTRVEYNAAGNVVIMEKERAGLPKLA